MKEIRKMGGKKKLVEKLVSMGKERKKESKEWEKKNKSLVM